MVPVVVGDGGQIPLLRRECRLSCWGWGCFHSRVPGRSAQCPVVCWSRSLFPSLVRLQSTSIPSTWKQIQSSQPTCTIRLLWENSPAPSPCYSTCWFSSMISASLPPFLDNDGFFLRAGVLCWTRCGVGMFLGTVGDVLCGPGVVRDDQKWLEFEIKKKKKLSCKASIKAL